MKIIGKKFAHNKTLQFLGFLHSKYPIPNVTVRFQKEPCLVIECPDKDVYLYGACSGTEIIISTLESDPRQQLKLAAYEYLHAMQFYTNTAIFEVGSVVTSPSGMPMQVVADEEADDLFFEAELRNFSTYVERCGGSQDD